MAKKNKSGWYSFVRWFPGEWYIETMPMDCVTLCAYMRLAACARNNAEKPGTLSTILSMMATSAGITMQQVWVALLRMTRYVSAGAPLVKLETSDDGKNWREIDRRDSQNMESDKPDPFMTIRASFAWIEREEKESNEHRKSEAERIKKYRERSSTNAVERVQTRTNAEEQRNTESTAKSKSKSKSKSNTCSFQDSDFEKWFNETFWKAYPKRVSKPQAERAARKAYKEAGPDRIMAALDDAKESDHRFSEERFVPYPASWLNSEPWNNEKQAAENNGKPECQVLSDCAAALKNPAAAGGMGSLFDV